MKKNLNIKSSGVIFSLITCLAVPFFINNATNYDAAKAKTSYTPTQIELPTTLYLKHNNEKEVRDYYSSLIDLPSNELKGFNLLKNLKPILKNNSTYVDYNTVWQTSCITERDWERSPIETIPCDNLDLNTMTITGYKDSYNYKGKGGDDPLLWVLYRNDNGKHNITINAYHNPSEGVGGLNKEHVWCQSRGFKGNPVTGPAGTDVHHLIVADAMVNQASHNNISYGDVVNYYKNEPNAKFKVMGSYEGTKETYIVGNYRGTNNDVSGEVFEPIANHKGDIARAIFYMAARYNNLANIKGEISDFEPYLTINNSTMAKSSEYSSDTKPVNMSYLKYLYQWHIDDPVDDFEIYRNDLIYNNFQHNRNPFVDFPSWVDLIWTKLGENKSSSKAANPSADKVSIYGSKPGEGEGEVTPEDVKVNDISLNVTNKDLKVGEKFKLDVAVTPSNATNKTLIYETSNNKVASVDQLGNVTAIGNGTCDIFVKTSDGSNISKTCKVNVTASEEVIPPLDGETTFKDKTTIYGVEAKPTALANIDSGNYFITVNNSVNEIYLDANNMNLVSGKLNTTSSFNRNLKTGYFKIVKQADGKTYNIINPITNQYLGYDSGTNLCLEDETSKTSNSDWIITSDPNNDVLLTFANKNITDRGLLYQTSNHRFGGYKTTNLDGSSYLGVSLYKCAYTYDVLINKLKQQDCVVINDQNYINDISNLYNNLTINEQNGLNKEYFVAKDGNTYSAYYVYHYALNYKNNPAMFNLTGSYNSVNELLLIGILSSALAVLVIAIKFITLKRKYQK